jgi:hypothetical protein
VGCVYQVTQLPRTKRAVKYCLFDALDDRTQYGVLL